MTELEQAQAKQLQDLEIENTALRAQVMGLERAVRERETTIAFVSTMLSQMIIEGFRLKPSRVWPHERFCWSLDPDAGFDDPTHMTRQNARNAAVRYMDTELGGARNYRVWTGKAVREPLSAYFGLDTDWVIDSVVSNALFALPEHVGAWLDDIPGDARRSLDDIVETGFAAMLDAWADQYQQHPEFFGVEEVEEHHLLNEKGEPQWTK